ncbi:glutathione S-transferase C-terminal domain-containing protein [Streptomyces prasinus]|uniref:Glutathione S-transferase family protein n=2 Tax=Streptomyces prasinus TaxID=67345 RepID=A0ABX6B7R3_9ACTN|nr:glutathione S-transferase C-terminal domain-containing protein [Streptomyces prasinus]QEV09865.1 glutathione S-transferase family protein [Streptomyces prasinus]
MSVISPAPHTIAPATPSPLAPVFRGRIGRDARSGHYAVPRRYRLHLSTADPACLRIAVTHTLLGLDDACAVTFLPAVPDRPDGGYTELSPLYDASAHRYTGPALAPVLSDDWSGRIVSTHAPDIARDLARRFDGGRRAVYPRGAESEIEAVERMCAQGIDAAAGSAGKTAAEPAARAGALGTLLRTLGSLDNWLMDRDHMIRDRITVADVELWVALVRLDTVHRHHLDAGAVRDIAGYETLWAYARRLAGHPAFGGHLDVDAIARRHRAHCHAPAATGTAVQVVTWPDSGRAPSDARADRP